MYSTRSLITIDKDMAEIVTISSKAGVGVLSCLKSKLAFLEKQFKIWEKLYEIVNQGGLNDYGTTGERVSYSIAGTIKEIYDEAQKLKKGNLTDIGSFELLEKLITARDHYEAEVYLGNYWKAVIDKTIAAIISCMDYFEDDEQEKQMMSWFYSSSEVSAKR